MISKAPDMKSVFGLFNVDTQQPSDSHRCLVFRPRVEPIAEVLQRLLDFAAATDTPIVHTACVNAGPVEQVISDNTLFIPIDDDETRWGSRLARYKAVYLQKVSCGSPEENVRTRAYDIFHANPNTVGVLARMGITRWGVFGDSVRFCLQSTVRGLLSLGYDVTALADAIGPGIDSEAVKTDILRQLARDGARVETVAEFLGRCG